MNEIDKGEPEEQAYALIDRRLVLTSADLLPGDILLYRPLKPHLIQQGITKVTGSPYTHASIYVGGGYVADSNIPLGVKRNMLTASIAGTRCVAVLRSQMGFGDERRDSLRQFVDSVIDETRPYDFMRALNFSATSRAYFDNQLDIIGENFGTVTAAEDYARRSFFCSAFVVACTIAVGIIGPTAQVAYLPEAISPRHLYRDPTFGWLLGYLVPPGGDVPTDDPVLVHTPRWVDCEHLRWW